MLHINALVIKDRLGPISGELKAGRLTLLIGPNGSGKSSLLNALAGLNLAASSYQSGQIYLKNTCLSTLSIQQLACTRAMLAQDSVLPHGLMAYELLALAAAPLGGVTKAVSQSLARLEEPLGLSCLYQRPVNRLSGGEQQRLLIASTLLQVDPRVNQQGKILLLDEPLAGLDWQHQLATLRLLREYAALGLIVIASLHDINLACQYGDDIWCLAQGKLVAQGTPEVITPPLIKEVFSVTVARLEQDGASVLVPI
ncbi:ATP-binding cassette domain-containing protein [Oceanisphaera avium]|uniref:ABC transporter n=1 Tax=Oceanisphaera avium TaxID=1903694 RepID=A0A1Y0CWT1_9GAMM|nr:ATP-binding cassette domain-containing protein [Oceanisphaera avium]ART79464.1 ABC transporter [Oceanisphaera avium]